MQSHSTTTLEILGSLIGFPTVSAQSNIDLINYTGDYLSAFGVDPLIHFNPERSKANLLASIGPRMAGGLMLAGHTDVVPAEGQAWSSNPFEATVTDGHVFGRGACDMKGFIAVSLALLPWLSQQKLTRPVYFAFTYDEEVGCFGGARLAETIAAMIQRPDVAIVGEPTEMNIVVGHKGKLSLDCHVRGETGHSAHNDRAVNAAEIGAELVAKLRHMQRDIRGSGPKDQRFDPPYTTIHTGIIRSGSARNIVPDSCMIELEVRNLPSDDTSEIVKKLEDFAREKLLPEMRAIAPKSAIEFIRQSNIPPLHPNDNSELTRICLGLTGLNQTGVVSFATEAGLYQARGIDTIVCGPGSILQAHKADEFVSIAQLEKCELFLKSVISRLCVSPA